MTGAALLLVGHLVVPGALLWLGHDYRRRSPVARGLFWGGTVGYLLAIVAVTALLLNPPVYWGVDGGRRWLAIRWTPIGLPVLMATVVAFAVRSRGTQAAPRR